MNTKTEANGDINRKLKRMKELGSKKKQEHILFNNTFILINALKINILV